MVMRTHPFHAAAPLSAKERLRYLRHMADQYQSFAALAAREIEGVHYRVHVAERPSPIAVVAPHGGWIEPGTSHVATAIAGADYSLYRFDSLARRARENTMHITSTRFDEPRALALIAASEIVLAIHGRRNGDDNAAIWVGGRHEALRDEICAALSEGGFTAKAVGEGHPLSGCDPANICNRGRSGAGVQIEMPKALRLELLFARPRLALLAKAVRAGLAARS
ncbi:poly-gamma-glutamate hydrolase family protein [Methylocystis parvus]|nr:poly-gamma-glutamate hydrolase family protein [Methylocystis parvus]WBK01018.1 poly-gamma-glutamate hydrolase family protein [Methylocystis parvus OBBP]